MRFHEPASIERARAPQGTRVHINKALEQAAAYALDQQPADIFRISPAFNLFDWESALGSLSTAAVVLDDPRSAPHLTVLLRSLADGWRDARLEGHLHVPYVLTSMVTAIDLAEAHLDAETIEATERTVVDMARHLHHELTTQKWARPHRPMWNHYVIAHAGLAIGALALPDHPESDEWFAVSSEAIRGSLEVFVTEAGMTWEGLKYAGYCFRHLGILFDGLERRGLKADLVPPGGELEQRLRRVPRWYAHDSFPRGTWLQNYNDSFWDPHLTLGGFLRTFARYEPALCATVWDHLVGAAGAGTYGWRAHGSTVAEAVLYFPDVEPDASVLAELDDHFFCPEVGYLSARDGWTPDATVVTFNCGPHVGRIHDQADNNSFTVILGGEPLIIDSGGSNDSREGSRSSSLGHNLVLVDGRAERHSGKGTGVSGQILGFEPTDRYVAVAGDATSGYGHKGYNPVQRAVRQLVFVRGPIPYVVTFDDIRKDDDVHDFEYILHSPPGHLQVTGLTIDEPPPDPSTPVGAPCGQLVLAHPPIDTASTAVFDSDVKPYFTHTLWRFGAQTVTPRFVSVIGPLDTELHPRVEVLDPPARPKLRRRKLHGARVRVTVPWADGDDVITFTSFSDTAVLLRPSGKPKPVELPLPDVRLRPTT
jgi:hypothetical protein